MQPKALARLAPFKVDLPQPTRDILSFDLCAPEHRQTRSNGALTLCIVWLLRITIAIMMQGPGVPSLPEG